MKYTQVFIICTVVGALCAQIAVDVKKVETNDDLNQLKLIALKNQFNSIIFNIEVSF